MEKIDVVYLMMVCKNASIVRRTMQRLAGDGVRFWVHVDAKSTEDFSWVRSFYSAHFADYQQNIHWGGVEQPETAIRGIEESIGRWGVPRYFVLLSESDYPVKKGTEIAAFLRHADQDFIIANPLPCRNPVGAPGGWWLEDGRRRLECYALRVGTKSIATIEARTLNGGNLRQMAKVLRDCPMKIPRALKIALSFPRRRHPDGLRPCGGEFWFALRGRTAKMAADYCRQHQEFTDYHRHTSNPDEIMIPTLVHNLVPATEIAGHTLRHVNWADNGSASPMDVTLADKGMCSRLAREEECMFVRKVQDERVCAMIDRLVNEDS